MKKTICITILLMIMSVTFTGCATGELSGTYVNPKNSAHCVFEGSTFTMYGQHSKNQTVYLSGTYKVHSTSTSVTWPYNVYLYPEEDGRRLGEIPMQLSENKKVLLAGDYVFVKE